ncbi:MAG: hypothetical protein J6X48_06850 [Lachnospiraceae bacterium]|nr:hypothetical protein [Lachnospiraceae bacterium]
MKTRKLISFLLMGMIIALAGCADASDNLEAETVSDAKEDTSVGADSQKYEAVSLPEYASEAETVDAVLGRLDVVCRSEVALYSLRSKPVKVEEPAQPEVKKEEHSSDDSGNSTSNIYAVTYDTTKFTNDSITTPNTSRSYFVNAATQKAYKVPASAGTFTGQASSDISQAMLSDVFGISGTYGSGYNYVYDNSGYLSIYKNVEIQNTQGTVDQIYSQLENFADGNSNSLITALESFRASNTLNTLKYEYTNGQITIIQPGTEPADGNRPFNMDFTNEDVGAFTSLADGIKFSTNLNWGTIDALPLSYEDISNIANDSNGTYTDNEKALAQKILNQVGTIFSDREANLPGITSDDLAALRIRVIDINGTPGIEIIYPTTRSVDKPFPDATASTTTIFENMAVASNHYSSSYAVETPMYVYNNLNTYGTSYYLLENSLVRSVTASTINEAFLRTVFPAAGSDITTLLAEMNQNPSKTYTISINSSGYLLVTRN